MAAALKRGGEERLNHGRGQLRAREARADGHHVRVVVLAAELRLERIGAVRAADALDLVRRNGDADARRAHDDTVLAFPACDGTRGGLAENGIVAALDGVSAAVLDFTLEPVFSAIFAFFLLGERIGVKGYIGSALMLASLVLVEVDVGALFGKNKKKAD